MIEKFVCNALRTACIDKINRDFCCFPKLQEIIKDYWNAYGVPITIHMALIYMPPNAGSNIYTQTRETIKIVNFVVTDMCKVCIIWRSYMISHLSPDVEDNLKKNSFSIRMPLKLNDIMYTNFYSRARIFCMVCCEYFLQRASCWHTCLKKQNW